ncbi:MAG: NUDIX domain-containing protein, partial [Patescibacteria group bacterium]
MNKLYCTACGTLCRQLESFVFECTQGHRNYINPVPGSTVFIVKGRQVLYGRRAIEPHKGGLNIVGEIMHPGETAEACAVRGCKEEFNIDVKIVDYLGSYAGSYGERKTVNFVFVAEYVAGEAQAGDDLLPGSQHWR